MLSLAFELLQPFQHLFKKNKQTLEGPDLNVSQNERLSSISIFSLQKLPYDWLWLKPMGFVLSAWHVKKSANKSYSQVVFEITAANKLYDQDERSVLKSEEMLEFADG